VTCVIGVPGRRGFLCADRRVTSDSGERCPNERKLFRNPHMIVAGAGSIGRLHKVCEIVAGGAREPRELIEAVGDDTHVLVLRQDGTLAEVSEGAVYPHRKVRCIGTGGDLARGYLEKRALTEENARLGQALAARLRIDCGGGCDVERW
jgi:20S proteasome alpha/beta subunit